MVDTILQSSSELNGTHWTYVITTLADVKHASSIMD